MKDGLKPSHAVPFIVTMHAAKCLMLDAFLHYKHTAVVVTMLWRMEIVFLLYILAVLVYLLDFFSKQLGITLHWGYPAKRALSAMRKHGG